MKLKLQFIIAAFIELVIFIPVANQNPVASPNNKP